MMKKFYGIFIIMIMVQFSFAQKVGVPQLQSPADDFATAMPDAILDWDAVAGIGEIKYQVQLATNADFTNPVVDQSNIQLSAYYCENLLYNQEYFWRVKATDEAGTSNWSSVFSFTTFSSVVVDKPSNNADKQDLRVVFKWKNKVNNVTITGVAFYDLQIDTVNSFDSPYLNHYIVSGSLFEFKSDYLLFGATHFWRMRPANPNGAGEWSNIRTFETMPTVELDKPLNNASNQALDLTIKWKSLAGSNSDVFEYTIEVSTDEAFTSPVTYITSEVVFLPTFLKFNQEYWWRVKASHVNDVSVYSDVRKFSTVPKVTLVGPENNTVLETTRPTLEWTAISGVEGYQVRVAKTADLTNAVYYSTINSEYPLPTLNKDQDYFWSVRAYKTTDTCDWANNFTFHIPWNVGINDVQAISEVSVFPNPATTHIKVSFNTRNAGAALITITDVLGQNVKQDNIEISAGKFSKTIDVAELNKGIYFIEIQQNSTKKVMKFVVK